MDDFANAYHQAQRAIADLKAAVLHTLGSQGNEGMTNAELGRRLGIYAGHRGHEGHISRTMLALLEAEGVVDQDPKPNAGKFDGRRSRTNLRLGPLAGCFYGPLDRKSTQL
jgi:hypothetical protein